VFGYLNLVTETFRGSADGPRMCKAHEKTLQAVHERRCFPRFVGLTPTISLLYPSPELLYTQVFSSRRCGKLGPISVRARDLRQRAD
jgi:hypothetical protein